MYYPKSYANWILTINAVFYALGSLAGWFNHGTFTLGRSVPDLSRHAILFSFPAYRPSAFRISRLILLFDRLNCRAYVRAYVKTKLVRQV